MATIGPYIPSQGMSTTYNNLNIPQTQALGIQDCIVNFNSVVGRGNIAAANSALTSSPTIIGMGHYIDPAQIASSNTPLVVATTGTGSAAKKVYTGILAANGTISFTDRTGAVSLSNAVTEPWQFDSLNGILIGVGNSGNSDPPIQLTTFNGNIAALAGSPPFASCVKVVNNFCFLGRNLSATSTYSRVYWSAIADPQTWPAANFIDVRINDGHPIVALAAVGQDLIIFKRTSTSRLSTTTTSVAGAVTLAPLTTISDKIGCYGPGCAKNLPDGRVVFLDQNAHLQIFDGSVFMDVSQQSYPGPNVTQTNGVVAGVSQGCPFLSQFSVEVDPFNHYVFILTGTGSVKNNYTYDYLQNAWTENNFVGGGSTLFSTHCVVEGFANIPNFGSYMLMGDNAGVVWLFHGINDSGVAGPNNTSGTNVSSSFTMSIPLPEGFVPRTIMIPATLQSGGSLTVSVTFNGAASQSPAIIATSNAAMWNLVDLRSSTSNIPRPMSIQITIAVTAGKTSTIYPFYMSDEIFSNVA